jgi:Putative auto-transporter adhesin, head GIN domain
MKKLFLLLITFMSMCAFAQEPTVINDANAEKRTLTGSFAAITISDGIELLLTQGSEESIAVSASEPKYLARLKTEIENGTLKIYYDRVDVTWNGNDKRKLKAYVSFKTLEKLKASSGSSVHAKSVLSSNKMEMNFTSGSLFTGDVNIQELDITQNSGSQIDITGKAEKVKVDLSSGAIFKGYDLAVEYCDAKASSGGAIRINVNRELNAKANSGGGIRYKGNGVIKEVDVNSGGIVKKA